MDLTYLSILSVGGILVVGLLTVVGAIVISLLVAGVAQAGLAAGGHLTRMRTHRAEVTDQAGGTSGTRAGSANFGHDAQVAHELLARQAWWRLRC